MRQIPKGSTNRSVDLYIIDATDGTPEVGVAWNTAGIDLKYRRDLEAAVSVTEATLAALTTAHTDGGFLEIGNGAYRFDLPDAAWATGADHVTVYGTVTGMIVLPVTVQLVGYDPEGAHVVQTGDSFARIGATGSGLTSLASQASVDTIDDFLDTEVAAIKTKTDFLPSATAGSAGGVFIAGTNAATTITTALTTTFTGNLTGSVDSVTNSVGSVTGAVGSVSGLTAATVHSDLDDIQARLPAALTGAGNMKADALAVNGSTAAAALMAILNGSTVVYQGTVTGTATTTTLVDSGLTQAAADWWKGRIIIFTSVLTLQATDITAFDPATDTLTFTATTGAPTGATYVII